MKFYVTPNLRIRVAVFAIFLFSSFASMAQDCSETQPNVSVCDNTVADDFNSATTFTGTEISLDNNRFQATCTPNSNVDRIILSPVYFKNNLLPHTIIAGGKFSAGSNATIINVRLEVVRESDGSVIASCERNGLNISGNTESICFGVTSVDITEGLQFRYRFIMNTTAVGGSSASRFVAFDDFSFGGQSNAPLPVKMGAFSASRTGSQVKLEWNTVSESMNRGFEIQLKKADASDFSTVAFVPSQADDGNSEAPINYSYTDENISQGASLYRLKQIDLDGKISYTEIRAVDGYKQKAGAMVFPHPAVGSIHLVFGNTDRRNIELYDINGKIMQQWNGQTSSKLDIQNLKAGIYMVRITDINSGSVETKRVLVK